MEPMKPSQLPGETRMAVAKFHGTAHRWGVGPHKDKPLTEAVAALHEVSTDPVALGVVFASELAAVELDGYAWQQRTVDMLRQAGADEDTAERVLAWRRTTASEARAVGTL